MTTKTGTRAGWNGLKYRILDTMFFLGRPVTSMTIAKYAGLTVQQVQNELSRWRKFRNYIIGRPRADGSGYIYVLGWRGRRALFNMKEYEGILSFRTKEMHSLPIKEWDEELRQVRERIAEEDPREEQARFQAILDGLKKEREAQSDSTRAACQTAET